VVGTSLKVTLAKVKFVADISRMGEGNKIIWIPRRLHKEIDEKFANKQVRITIDDEI
jgi:hypothetical protein